MRFEYSCPHHCSPARFPASAHARRSLFTISGTSVVSASLRVRVIRRTCGCPPGAGGLQRVFPHFPAADGRCRRCFWGCMRSGRVTVRPPRRLSSQRTGNSAETPKVGAYHEDCLNQGASDDSRPSGTGVAPGGCRRVPPAPSAKPPGAFHINPPPVLVGILVRWSGVWAQSPDSGTCPAPGPADGHSAIVSGPGCEKCACPAGLDTRSKGHAPRRGLRMDIGPLCPVPGAKNAHVPRCEKVQAPSDPRRANEDDL
ncbi:hypothetical protein RCH07_001116 [Arthrobacter sp. CG_A4]|nr:hypothetical protein [Arthrobacter sp. CG_A4]